MFSFVFFCFLFLRRKHILPQATRGSQETFAPILPRAHCPPANEFSSWEQLSTVIGSHARTCTGAIYTAIQRLAASFKLAVPRPLKAFQRMLSLVASASSVLQLGLLHMPRCSSGPLEEPSVDGTGRAPGHGLQMEGGLDRHLQLRLGGGGGGGGCATANWSSASSQRRKVTFTSTAWECWQYVWAFTPLCQT